VTTSYYDDVPGRWFLPRYMEGTFTDATYAGIHLGRLVRTYRDALCVLNPVLAFADSLPANDLGRELEEIIRLWNSTAMVPFFDRAHKILDEIDELMDEERFDDHFDCGSWTVVREVMRFVLVSHEKALRASMENVEAQRQTEPALAST
jgi:hypothetical protein